MSKIQLNQAELLRGLLQDKHYQEHTKTLDFSNLEEVVSKLSEKQYKYILHLIDFKRWITIKTILSQYGLKNKQL